MASINQNWEIPSFILKEFKTKQNDFCLCVPILNEGERFQKQLSLMAKLSTLVDIIILDGGSTDESVKEKFLRDNSVRALLVKTGEGKLSSQLRIGYGYALREGYKGIVTIDGNGKDRVSDISLFLQKLKGGYDFIQGSRFIKGGKEINTPFLRLMANKKIHVPLINLKSSFKYTDTTNGFRAYSAKFLSDPRVMIFRNIFSDYELLFYLSVRAAQLNYKITEVPVERKYPKGKIPTKINLIDHFFLLVSLIKTIMGKYHP